MFELSTMLQVVSDKMSKNGDVKNDSESCPIIVKDLEHSGQFLIQV